MDKRKAQASLAAEPEQRASDTETSNQVSSISIAQNSADVNNQSSLTPEERLQMTTAFLHLFADGAAGEPRPPYIELQARDPEVLYEETKRFLVTEVDAAARWALGMDDEGWNVLALAGLVNEDGGMFGTCALAVSIPVETERAAKAQLRRLCGASFTASLAEPPTRFQPSPTWIQASLGRIECVWSLRHPAIACSKPYIDHAVKRLQFVLGAPVTGWFLPYVRVAGTQVHLPAEDDEPEGVGEVTPFHQTNARYDFSEIEHWLRKSQDPTNRRIIYVDREQELVGKQAISALLIRNQPETLFRQDGAIVRLQRKAGRPQVEEADKDMLLFHLTEAAHWYQHNSKQEPVLAQVPAWLPGWMLRAPEHVLRLPELCGITDIPLARPDGTLRTEPGYDAETGWYYAPSGLELAPIPDQPSRDEIRLAKALLHDLLQDFPFQDDASEANAYAFLATCVLRQSIPGLVPLAVIDANAPGAGKGKLLKLGMILATGDVQGLVPAPKTEEEWSKTLLTAVKERRAIIALDECHHLYSTDLASMLTSQVIEGRQLGANRMIRAENRSVWASTGINTQLGKDIFRRTYFIRLMVNTADHWRETAFKYPDDALLERAKAQRSKIVWAILTLYRAWKLRGEPVPQGVATMGEYRQWCRTLAGLLDLAGTQGFLGNLETANQHVDRDSVQWADFLKLVHERRGGEPFMLRDLADAILADDDLLDALPEQLAHQFLAGTSRERDDNLSTSTGGGFKVAYGGMRTVLKPGALSGISKVLDMKVNTPYGKEGYRLIKDGKNRKGFVLWRVEPSKQP